MFPMQPDIKKGFKQREREPIHKALRQQPGHPLTRRPLPDCHFYLLPCLTLPGGQSQGLARVNPDYNIKLTSPYGAGDHPQQTSWWS